jgi:hypothetical protein
MERVILIVPADTDASRRASIARDFAADLPSVSPLSLLLLLLD